MTAEASLTGARVVVDHNAMINKVKNLALIF